MTTNALGGGARLFVAPLALLLAFCHGGGQRSSTPTAPVVPTVAPTPPPVAPDPPLSASCAKLPPGDPNAKCRDDSPTFLDDVVDAIDTLRRERADLFNGDEVQNVGAYYVGIIRILDRKGLCAGFDGEELGVKTSNDYNDQFKILTSRNLVRTSRAFLGTCYPAAFPAPQTPLPPPPAGCPLPSSRSLACGTEAQAVFYDDVAAAIDQVLRDKPQLFDFTQHVPGTDWPLITDLSGYYQAIIAILDGKGYCVIFDGEEVEVKRTNELTEHFKIDYSNAYVRKGPKTYRGTCYPAAF